MKKLAAILLIFAIVLVVPTTAYGGTPNTKVVPSKTLYTTTSNSTTISGRVTYAGGQLVVLYNLKGKPVSYQKIPNTGRACDFALKASNLKKGNRPSFISSP